MYWAEPREYKHKKADMSLPFIGCQFSGGVRHVNMHVQSSIIVDLLGKFRVLWKYNIQYQIQT